MPRHFLLYLTANDQPSYLKDCLHAWHSVKYDPGVQVNAYICISEVRPFTKRDLKLLRGLAGMWSGRSITCLTIILKSNVGRDFSSLYHSLREIHSLAEPDDYILVRNRTSWGPLKDGWYSDFIDQSKRFADVALTGVTINPEDHYRRGRASQVAHVQTYAYLSQWKYLSTLIPHFPGLTATTRDAAIMEGEIELSQQLLQRGWCITSLQQPDMVIDRNNQDEVKTLQEYPKVNLVSMPITRKAGTSRSQYYLRAVRAYVSLLIHVAKSNKHISILRRT